MNQAGVKSIIQGEKKQPTQPTFMASFKEVVESEMFLHWHLWCLTEKYYYMIWYPFLEEWIRVHLPELGNQNFSNILSSDP